MLTIHDLATALTDLAAGGETSRIGSAPVFIQYDGELIDIKRISFLNTVEDPRLVLEAE